MQESSSAREIDIGRTGRIAAVAQTAEIIELVDEHRDLEAGGADVAGVFDVALALLAAKG